MDPSRGDSRYNLNYSMSSIGLSLADQADLYGNPAAAAALGGRPPSGGLIQTMGGSGGIGLSGRSSGGLMSNSAQCQSLSNSTSSSAGGPSQQQQQQQQQQQHQSRGIKRTNSDCYDEHHRGVSSGSMAAQMQGLESCSAGSNNQQQQSGSNVSDVVDDNYNSMQSKKSPPANGKKTKGRVKIKMEYIDNKLRRYTTFSKRKTGIMKKAYELSTLTGTQVMLLVASETGHVYTFATRKLQPMITSEAGKQLIQTCLNSPDPPSVGGGDQRMSATGFEETELSYNIADEDSKDERSSLSSPNDSEESSDVDSPLVDASTIGNAFKVSGSNQTKSAIAFVLNGQAHQCTSQKQFQSDTSLKSTALSNQLEVGNIRIKPPSIAPRTSVPAPEVSNLNNVMYSSSSLSSIPQEVLLQLIQSGHLQLHTEDDGSGHQYITIPLPMPSSAPTTTPGYQTIANNVLATNASFNYTDASSKTTIFEGGTTTPQSTGTNPLSGDLNIKQELMD